MAPSQMTPFRNPSIVATIAILVCFCLAISTRHLAQVVPQFLTTGIDEFRSHHQNSPDAINSTGNEFISGPLQWCEENPYSRALTESLDLVSRRMDETLSALPLLVERANNDTYRNWNHERFSFFNTSLAHCSNTTCIGGPCKHDLSKIVCGSEELKQETGCIVYSIGGNNQWEFEMDALAKTPCEVHTFDCTGSIDRFRKPPNGRLHFHHVCLGTSHEDAATECTGLEKCGETWTLLEMQNRLGHTRIDLLKVDIEGWEWPLFESWPLLVDPAADKTLLPMQVLVEIHYRTQFAALRPPGTNHRHDFKSAVDMANLHDRLLRMGYVAVVRDDNRFCRHCTELTLVRIRCPASGRYAAKQFISA